MQLKSSFRGSGRNTTIYEKCLAGFDMTEVLFDGSNGILDTVVVPDIERLVMAISAPARARARAKYCPRPRLVPVTSATRPDKSNRGSIMVESLRLKYDLQQSRFASVEATEPRRPLVERSHCGKKWFNADRTARDE